jgi:hypothetical protein
MNNVKQLSARGSSRNVDLGIREIHAVRIHVHYHFWLLLSAVHLILAEGTTFGSDW